jgi:hypothetical protein
MRLVLLLPVVAVLACARGVRPTGEESRSYAGVPVSFGEESGPAVEWDFGDGSPQVTGALVQHAFSRAGRFTVIGTGRDGYSERRLIDVVPRPVTAAIPSAATASVYLSQVGGNLEKVIDFLEKLLGAESAQRMLDNSPLSYLAVELSTGGGQSIDPEEGMGLFTTRAFDGAVALLGVVEEEKTLLALVAHLESRGGIARQEPDRSVRIQRPDGGELVLFTDRGYLYVVIPKPEVTEHELAALLALVRRGEQSLEASPVVQQGRARAGSGAVYLALTPPEAQESPLRGLFATVALDSQGMTLEGALYGDVKWTEGGNAGTTLLGNSPSGPVAALFLSTSSRPLLELLFGAAGGQGPRASGELERALEALNGDIAGLAYFDPVAFYANLVNGSEKPEPRGTILIEAGLQSAEPVEKLLLARLSSLGVRYDRIQERGSSRFRAVVQNVPVELELAKDRLRLTGGESQPQRPSTNLARELGARFGERAFSPGHLSILVDVGQLLRELETPREISGIDPRRLVMVQGFSSAFLNQLTPIDYLFLDVGPGPEGGRVRGRLQFRKK